MNSNTKITKRCAKCNYNLPPSHAGKCPKCGSTKTKSHVKANLRINIGPTLRAFRIKKFCKNRPKIMILQIAIVLITTICGAVIGSLFGAAVGLITGLVIDIILIFILPASKVDKEIKEEMR